LCTTPQQRLRKPIDVKSAFKQKAAVAECHPILTRNAFVVRNTTGIVFLRIAPRRKDTKESSLKGRSAKLLKENAKLASQIEGRAVEYRLY